MLSVINLNANTDNNIFIYLQMLSHGGLQYIKTRLQVLKSQLNNSIFNSKDNSLKK